MTAGPSRFRFLAAYVAGRPVEIAEAAPGHPAWTDGQVIYVSAGGHEAEQRREVLVQSALLGAGSMDEPLVRALRARPAAARRYLAIEGGRVLAGLATRIPLAATLPLGAEPGTATPEQSLAAARGRGRVAEPPEWFGVIRPWRLHPHPHPAAPGRLGSDLPALSEDDDDGDGVHGGESKILRLFDSPLPTWQVLADYLRKMLGGPSAAGDGAAGAEMTARGVRRALRAGVNARPLPARVTPPALGGVGGSAGARYPEWDMHRGQYRPGWCRVTSFPLAADGTAGAGLARDDVLRRRLSRVCLGLKARHARPDGDEIDIDALIGLLADVRSGYSPPENVYRERRQLDPQLGVLILLDASGSGSEADPGGLAVHDRQARAAATLAATLEELGNRVAVYAFRSHGRQAVHLLAVKAFGERFGARGRARLGGLRASGYTRLGAAVRGAGDILVAEAGTPRRLLLILSDGFPYDDGYQGRYAEADSRKALDELRGDGIGCLCLSIGAAATGPELERVFGPAGYASAATLAALSPRMDELLLACLA